IGGSANGRNAFNNVAITHDENIYAGGYHNDYSLIPSPQYMFPVVMGNDSLPVLGGHQFLLGKLKGNSNLLKGRVYADFNNNGIFSGYDAPIQNLLINHQPSNSLNSSHLEGYYQVSVDTGDYLLTPQINVPPYFDVAPISRNGNLASTGNEIDELDFRLVPTGNFKEVSIDITQINRLRAGSQVQYMVNYKNNGTNMASGEYYLVFDNALQFLTSDSAASGTFSDSLVFQYVNLAPFESRSNALSFSTGTTLTFADTLNIRSVILPVAGDTIPSNNTYALDSPVFGPFDPNQKTVLPKESIRIGDALAGTQEVEYTLQFQNTGNDTAFNVIVTDSLSGLLNINTLRLISSSHPFKLNVISNNLLEFRFMNIMLVDSFQNEPKSHGFVKFRIKPHTSVSLIDTIYNNCHIFFDYNLPITTNTVKTFFKTPDVPPLVDSVAFISFTAFKSNNESVLQWSTNYEQNLDHYEIQRSPDSMNFVTIGQKNGLGTNGGSYTHSDISPVHGLNYYRLKTVFASGNSRLSQIVMVDHTPVIVNAGFSIGPVPAKDYLRINLGDIQLPVSATADIYDGLGRLVIKNVANVNSPSYNINISSLSAGMYFIRIVLGREVYEKAFSK
ncbi:MAG: T9SS type A sorting domain-containing protein, partial [Chitinophagaceae bacterium]